MFVCREKICRDKRRLIASATKTRNSNRNVRQVGLHNLTDRIELDAQSATIKRKRRTPRSQFI